VLCHQLLLFMLLNLLICCHMRYNFTFSVILHLCSSDLIYYYTKLGCFYDVASPYATSVVKL
jgi:hypothetical protein